MKYLLRSNLFTSSNYKITWLENFSAEIEAADKNKENNTNLNEQSKELRENLKQVNLKNKPKIKALFKVDNGADELLKAVKATLNDSQVEGLLSGMDSKSKSSMFRKLSETELISILELDETYNQLQLKQYQNNTTKLIKRSNSVIEEEFLKNTEKAVSTLIKDLNNPTLELNGFIVKNVQANSDDGETIITLAYNDKIFDVQINPNKLYNKFQIKVTDSSVINLIQDESFYHYMNLKTSLWNIKHKIDKNNGKIKDSKAIIETKPKIIEHKDWHEFRLNDKLSKLANDPNININVNNRRYAYKDDENWDYNIDINISSKLRHLGDNAETVITIPETEQGMQDFLDNKASSVINKVKKFNEKKAQESAENINLFKEAITENLNKIKNYRDNFDDENMFGFGLDLQKSLDNILNRYKMDLAIVSDDLGFNGLNTLNKRFNATEKIIKNLSNFNSKDQLFTKLKAYANAKGFDSNEYESDYSLLRDALTSDLDNIAINTTNNNLRKKSETLSSYSNLTKTEQQIVKGLSGKKFNQLKNTLTSSSIIKYAVLRNKNLVDLSNKLEKKGEVKAYQTLDSIRNTIKMKK